MMSVQLNMRFVPIAAMFCGTVASAQSSFQGLGYLPNGIPGSFAHGVSPDGSTVVGFGYAEGRRSQTFRWNIDSGMVQLPSLPGTTGGHWANAASSGGEVIVGMNVLDASETDHAAVMWQGAEITDLGFFPELTIHVVAYGVTPDGTTIVGSSSAIAFRWTEADGLQRLPGLENMSAEALGISADGSVIVGRVFFEIDGTTFFEERAFRWNADGWIDIGDLPGGIHRAYAQAVSGDGRVVIGSSNSGNNTNQNQTEAFRWTEELGMVRLGDLGGSVFSSRAFAVNHDGSVIVGTAAGGGAFIWTAHDGMRSLRDVLTHEFGLDLSEWTGLGTATGISADGKTIVGTGLRNGVGEAWIARLDRIPCRADFNGDGFADSRDFFEFLTALFTTPACPEPCTGGPNDLPCPADFNRDCQVNSADFFDFLSRFLVGCP